MTQNEVAEEQITTQMIMDHPTGAPTLPDGVSVPLNCVKQLELWRKWKEHQGEKGYEAEPYRGGYGTWNPIKSECTGCVGSLQCFAKTYRVPNEEIDAALEKARGRTVIPTKHKND